MHTVAVLAGGLGRRLRALSADTLPKPLYPVLGRPFLDWKLEGLAEAGVTQVVLLVGHEGQQIRAHVGDGARFGLAVEYADDGPTLLGTGGALCHALPLLPSIFWVTYGDSLLQVDLPAAESTFAASECQVLMTVLRNRNQWQPSNVAVKSGCVAAYNKDHPPSGAEHIDYGMLLFDRSAWNGFSADEAFDLGDVLEPLVNAGQVIAFEVTARFHDIGTSDAVRETESFLTRNAAPER